MKEKRSVPQPRLRNLTSGSPLHVERAGLASFMFAFLHPRDAKAATVSADNLTLTRTFGFGENPLSGDRDVRDSYRVVLERHANPCRLRGSRGIGAVAARHTGVRRRTGKSKGRLVAKNAGYTRRDTPFRRQSLGSACGPTQVHDPQRLFRPRT